MGPHEPNVITVNMARSSFDHLTKLLQKGVMRFNTAGNLELSPNVKLLVEALYHALTSANPSSVTPAGPWPPNPTTGAAGVLRIEPGDPSEVTTLKAMELMCLTDVDNINKQARFNLVIEL